MSKTPLTKTSLVQTMLAKPKGASLAAICKATGWQAHSARAALSGLRKTGFVIERTQSDSKAGSSVYRIVGNPDLTQ